MNTRTSAILVTLSILFLGGADSAQSTINDVKKYAYGANTGWLNFSATAATGVVVGEAFLSGYIYAANFGWITLGDGSPANGHTYANASAADIGVNHDGAGALSGFGYSGNIGWINFGWAAVNDPNQPWVDLVTGQLAGYVYSPNTGWMTLSTGILFTNKLAAPDTDADGMADAWEIQKFGDVTLAGIGTDSDKDGQSDAAEYTADTNPKDASDYLRVVSQTYNGEVTQVTLRIGTTRPSRSYLIQTSSTLLSEGPDGWTSLGSPFLADSGAVTTTLVSFPAGSKRFFRVVAERPLQ